jgi:hypothetical protein
MILSDRFSIPIKYTVLMTETAAAQTPFNPQFIIVISASPARQHAIKALLGVVMIDTPLHIVESYAEAKPFIAAGKHSKALVVIDGVSLDDKSEMEIKALKEGFPETRCLLLVESSNTQRTGTGELAISKNFCADEVLVGSVTGNQFIDSVRRLIERDGLADNTSIYLQAVKQ